MRITFYLLLLFSALTSFAEDSFERQQMNARTQPVGQVNLEDQTQVTISPKKEEPVAANNEVLAGQKIYEQYCSVCHKTGLAGAPKFRDENDWKPKLDNKSITELTQSAIKGVNAMPAKGTCMSCSEKEILQETKRGERWKHLANG